MAEQAVIHLGENSPEHVALKLYQEIADLEADVLRQSGGRTRKWVLDTFAECLETVRNPEQRRNGGSQLKARARPEIQQARGA
jgi:hypothetical protein